MSIILITALALGSPKDLMEQYGTVEARRLQVQLKLDLAVPEYSGTSRITFVHSKTIDEVVVHAAEGMELTEVAFVRGSRRWPATATAMDKEQIRIAPEQPIGVEGLKLPRKKAAMRGEPLFASESRLTLEMQFTNTVNDQAYGLYRFEHEGQPYLITQFEADDARESGGGREGWAAGPGYPCGALCH